MRSIKFIVGIGTYIAPLGIHVHSKLREHIAQVECVVQISYGEHVDQRRTKINLRKQHTGLI